MTLFDPAEVAPVVTGPVQRIRLVVAYDGTDFHGFAEQHGQKVRTVGGALRAALEQVAQQPVELTCAGRTDAGVHAWGQVVNCDLPVDLAPERVMRSLTKMLGPAIVVRSVDLVSPAFGARYDAQWRSYEYTVVNRPVADPFRARYAWWVPQPLDLRAMRTAADVFIGEHDFAAFCRKGPEGTTTVRRVIDSVWCDLGDGVLRYDVRATAFCWQMVRSLVGTLVDVGLGKMRSGDILGVLRAGDRSLAGQVAPSHGLCLREVGYEIRL